MKDLSFLDELGIPNGKTPEVIAGAVDDVLIKYGQIIVDRLRDGLTDTSRLALSIRFQNDPNELKIIMNDYWQSADGGRKPGTPPPIKPIIEWLNNYPSIKSKFGLGNKKLKGKAIKNFQGLNVATPTLSAAFAISRSIGNKGSKGNGFFKKAITQSLIKKMQKEISVAIGKQISFAITIDKYGTNGNKSAASV